MGPGPLGTQMRPMGPGPGQGTWPQPFDTMGPPPMGTYMGPGPGPRHDVGPPGGPPGPCGPPGPFALGTHGGCHGPCLGQCPMYGPPGPMGPPIPQAPLGTGFGPPPHLPGPPPGHLHGPAQPFGPRPGLGAGPCGMFGPGPHSNGQETPGGWPNGAPGPGRQPNLGPSPTFSGQLLSSDEAMQTRIAANQGAPAREVGPWSSDKQQATQLPEAAGKVEALASSQHIEADALDATTRVYVPTTLEQLEQRAPASQPREVMQVSQACLSGLAPLPRPEAKTAQEGPLLGPFVPHSANEVHVWPTEQSWLPESAPLVDLHCAQQVPAPFPAEGPHPGPAQFPTESSWQPIEANVVDFTAEYSAPLVQPTLFSPNLFQADKYSAEESLLLSNVKSDERSWGIPEGPSLVFEGAQEILQPVSSTLFSPSQDEPPAQKPVTRLRELDMTIAPSDGGKDLLALLAMEDLEEEGDGPLQPGASSSQKAKPSAAAGGARLLDLDMTMAHGPSASSKEIRPPFRPQGNALAALGMSVLIGPESRPDRATQAGRARKDDSAVGPFSQQACGLNILLSEDGYVATRSCGCRESAVLGSAALERQPQGLYFEVEVRQTVEGWLGGLAVGLTHSAPSHFQDQRLPDKAWRLPDTFIIGYAGSAYLNGRELRVSWKSDALKVGQRVGLLLSDKSDLCVFVDGAEVAKVEGHELLAAGLRAEALYPVVDVSNATLAVALCSEPRLPQ